MSLPLIGALYRAFAKDPASNDQTAERAAEKAEQLLSLGFDHVVVVVSEEKNKGETVLTKLTEAAADRFSVLSAPGTDAQVLNRGVEYLKTCGMEIAFVVSGKAVSNITPVAIPMLKVAFAALPYISAVGLTLDENLNPVINAGFLQNTACAWRIKDLESAGGFTSTRGVEETSVLGELHRKGKRTAIFQQGVQAVQLREDDGGRFAEICGSKWPRIEEELKRCGSTKELIGQMVAHRINLSSPFGDMS